MENETRLESLPETEADTTPDPVAAAATNSKKSWVIASAATGMAVVAAVVGMKVLDHGGAATTATQNAAAASSAAGDGSGFQPPTMGTIASISGSSFTVNATDFSGATSVITVDTSDSTAYTEAVAGTLSDLAVGDTIVATGTTTDGTLAATRITQSDGSLPAGGGGAPPQFSGETPPQGAGGAPPAAPSGNAAGGTGNTPAGMPPGGGNRTAGEITKISGNTITIKTTDGSTTTVTTTSDTVVTITKKIAFKDLKVGDNVRVTGTQSGTTVTATRVATGDTGFGGGPGGPPNGANSASTASTGA